MKKPRGKITPVDDDAVLDFAKSRLAAHQLWRGSELEENWEVAYGYYRGDLPPPTKATDSTVNSMDVADTVEWLLPAIMKPLIESPDVVRFDPVTPEDQDQADLESDYVHQTFIKKCNGFTKLYVHIKDALLLKNAVFCTYWDEEEKNQKEDYRDLTEVELADLLNPDDGSTVTLRRATTRVVPMETIDGAPKPVPRPPPQVPPPPGPLGMGGGPTTPQEPAQPVSQILYDVSVRRVRTNGRPVVENCAPERFVVDINHGSINLDDARWCAYRLVKSRGELIALGYDEDLIDEIPLSESDFSDQVAYERKDVERSFEGSDANETEDKSQDLYDVWRLYAKADFDGDGMEEQYLIILGGIEGTVLLDWYEVPENPFSASTPFIAGHKFYGLSVFDKVYKLADHKTKVLRMLEDSLDLQNNPRKKVLRGACNLDDVLMSRVGGIWRVDRMDAVEEVPAHPIQQQAQQLLDYYDKMRSERTGVDPNAQAITNVMPEESMNTAVERVLSMKEELVGLMIRVFAETGVKGMFIKLRNLMLRNMDRSELVQLRNKWFEVNPGNWVERQNTTVVVGLGTGDRYRKQSALLQVIDLQQKLAAGGMLGPLVSAERINYAISELIRVTGLGDPDDYVLDPALLEREDMNRLSPRGREALRAFQMQQAQQQQAQQAEQAKMEATAAMQQQLAQVQVVVEQIRAASKDNATAAGAEQSEKDRMAQMAQFMEEMRLKWAELVETSDAQAAKIAANVATTLIQQGGKNVESARALEMAKVQQQGDTK